MSLTEFPFGTAHQILNVQNAQIKMFLTNPEEKSRYIENNLLCFSTLRNGKKYENGEIRIFTF